MASEGAAAAAAAAITAFTASGFRGQHIDPSQAKPAQKKPLAHQFRRNAEGRTLGNTWQYSTASTLLCLLTCELEVLYLPK